MKRFEIGDFGILSLPRLQFPSEQVVGRRTLTLYLEAPFKKSRSSYRAKQFIQARTLDTQKRLKYSANVQTATLQPAARLVRAVLGNPLRISLPKK
jgi:hypothetical protein